MERFLLVAILAAAPVAHARRLYDNPVTHVLRQFDGMLGLPLANASTHFYNEALIDHFDATVEGGEAGRHWEQRYYVDDKFWGGEGFPVFLNIGGEGPQGPPSSRLLMWTLAEEHKALMVSLEHRFYGESYPAPDMGTAHLPLLSSEQALADLARFISYIAAFDPSKKDRASQPPLRLPAAVNASKWVAFGGSYPGALTVWLKLKYPALLAGAVGSSAPVFAQYDYYQYAQATGAAMAYKRIGGSAQCAQLIKQAVPLIHAAGVEGLAGLLPKALQPCGELDQELDMAAWEQELFGNFQGAVQYNLLGRGPTVADLCQAIIKADDAVQGFADATALLTNGECVPSSWEKDVIAPLANTTFSGKGCGLDCESGRQWIFQSCNEFGYFQTTTGEHIFNGFDLNIDNAGALICEQAFGLEGYTGPKANARGLIANTDYGGRAVQGMNILMPNGNMDPWHALSVVNDTDAFFNAGVPAFGAKQRVSSGVEYALIDGTAHCRDMYGPGALEAVGVKDTASVQWAHAKVRAAVASFIA